MFPVDWNFLRFKESERYKPCEEKDTNFVADVDNVKRLGIHKYKLITSDVFIDITPREL